MRGVPCKKTLPWKKTVWLWSAPMGAQQMCAKALRRRAFQGDLVGRFRCHLLFKLTLVNYNNALSMCDTFLRKMLSPPIFVNYCQPKKRPTIWIWVQLLESLVISTPDINFGYQRIVHIWFAAILSESLDLTLLYISIVVSGTNIKFVRNNTMLSLKVLIVLSVAMHRRRTQVCRIKITFESLFSSISLILKSDWGPDPSNARPWLAS
jgi:hypothetical protein